MTDIEDTQEEEQVNETEPTEVEAPVQPDIVIPENWEPDVKDFINSIQDANGKKAIFDKLSNYEKGYQKKFQDIAQQRHQLDDKRNFTERYEEFERNLDQSMRANILSHYGNIPAYMRALHETDIMATRDPTRFIINYCRNNGITLDKINDYLNGTQAQQMQQAQDQEALRKQIMKEIEDKQRQQKLVDDMRSFANAKNDNGDLLHPLLTTDGFVDNMDKLYSIYPDKSLQELYDMVVWTNPQYREEQINASAQKIAQANDVAKAKSAIGVKPSIPSNKATQVKDWRSALDDELSLY